MKPKSWDEFEDMVCAAAKIRWNIPNFTRHGRLGQTQNGVDIYEVMNASRTIALQCKNTWGGISKSQVLKEINNAEEFRPKISQLFIATTADRDGPLQEEIRLLCQERQDAGQFSVDIIFWSDICSDLATEEKQIFKYFPELRPRIEKISWRTPAIYFTVVFCAAAIVFWHTFVRETSLLVVDFPSYVVASNGTMELSLSLSNQGNTDQTVANISPIYINENGLVTVIKSNLKDTFGSIEDVRVKKGEVLIKKIRFSLPASAEYDQNKPCVIPKALPQRFKIALNFTTIGRSGKSNVTQFLIAKGSVDSKKMEVSHYAEQANLSTPQSLNDFSRYGDETRKPTESGALGTSAPMMISSDGKNWITGTDAGKTIKFILVEFDPMKCLVKAEV